MRLWIDGVLFHWLHFHIVAKHRAIFTSKFKCVYIVKYDVELSGVCVCAQRNVAFSTHYLWMNWRVKSEVQRQLHNNIKIHTTIHPIHMHSGNAHIKTNGIPPLQPPPPPPISSSAPTTPTVTADAIVAAERLRPSHNHCLRAFLITKTRHLIVT